MREKGHGPTDGNNEESLIAALNRIGVRQDAKLGVVAAGEGAVRLVSDGSGSWWRCSAPRKSGVSITLEGIEERHRVSFLKTPTRILSEALGDLTLMADLLLSKWSMVRAKSKHEDHCFIVTFQRKLAPFTISA